MAATEVHRCFPPVADGGTRVLVLGSLPGEESLARGQYYVHPRNQFWRLIGAAIERDMLSLGYGERLHVLLRAGIGLWDTVAAARRRGSLDSNIRLHEASDVGSLASSLPGLRAIGFNGGKAAALGRSGLGAASGIDLVDLPSSSPAYTLPFETKLESWLQLRRYL